jgi:hypothetical protein
MPVEVRKVTTEGITRILIRDEGWIEIVPNSFNVVTLDFYVKVEGQDDQFTGLNYRSYIFNDKTSGKLICVAPDGVIGIEIDEEVSG